jgi:hypothetical protein
MRVSSNKILQKYENAPSHCVVTDIEQVQNEEKSFTFRWMFLQSPRDDAGEGQRWKQSVLNAWITSGLLPL